MKPKVTRAAAATAEDILESDLKSVVSGEKEKEDDVNLESKKREKSIVEWIGQPPKAPARNEDKKDEEKEEYVGAPLDSTEDGSPGNKEKKSRGYDREDEGIYDRKDTVLYDARYN